MSTLIVNSTTDFSGAVLSGIDTIDFTNLAAGATATFLASREKVAPVAGLDGLLIDASDDR